MKSGAVAALRWRRQRWRRQRWRRQRWRRGERGGGRGARAPHTRVTRTDAGARSRHRGSTLCRIAHGPHQAPHQARCLERATHAPDRAALCRRSTCPARRGLGVARGHMSAPRRTFACLQSTTHVLSPPWPPVSTNSSEPPTLVPSLLSAESATCMDSKVATDIPSGVLCYLLRSASASARSSGRK